VEVAHLSHYLQRVLWPSQVVVWDFWTINSRNLFPRLFFGKTTFSIFKSWIQFKIYELKLTVNRKVSFSESFSQHLKAEHVFRSPQANCFLRCTPPCQPPKKIKRKIPWQRQLPTSTRLSRRLGSFWVTNTSLFFDMFFRRWKVNPLSPTPQITGLIKRWWWYPYPPDV